MTIEIEKQYQWNSGFWSSMDVSKVVAELHSIQQEEGEISPEVVVEHAKSKKSVLHNYFIWDDEVAAARYRVRQASELLQRIEVRVLKDGEPRTVRAFEIISNPFNQQNFVSFDLSDGFSRSKRIALSDLNRALSRLNQYDEYSSVVKYVKKAQAELLKVSTETISQPPVLGATG